MTITACVVEIGEPVDLASVTTAFLRAHPLDRVHDANTNTDGLANLRRADRLFGGWTRVRLTRPQVLEVMLPWHLSEGGELELVPRSGLTVGQAVDRIERWGTDFGAANPRCAAKLAMLRERPWSPVFLSRGAVDHSDYADLTIRDRLTHLDGLHRMLAWELAGRLDGPDGIEAYVAGAARP